MRLTPTSSPITPAPTSDQINAAAQELLVDRHLINDDSLTIWEKRALFGKQRSQAQEILGSLANYTTERNPDNNDLVFKSNSTQELSRLVFRANPDDPKEYTAYFVKKFYNQGQEYSRRVERYNSNGELHGNGKPARIEENDEEQTIEYFENGQLHREGDQPAKILAHEDGTTVLWYKKEGKHHRDGNKPAIIESKSRLGYIKNTYYIEDEFQRTEIENGNN